jgi:2-methylaconitate cis-trans-isomerase PrpF
MSLRGIPCTIMRGGTSKGLFFRREVLPEDPNVRDEILLRIFGSGDPSQIDGLGGAQPHTSKVMIVWKSDRPGVDVEYLFGQVGIEERVIDWRGNCGNLTAAVGPFAIDEGLVDRVVEPRTVVRMLNVNTGKRVDAIVPVRDGKTLYAGDYMIDGVPNPGARIDLVWYDPGGSTTGKLLPTGNVVDELEVEGKSYEVTIVDAGNPLVFVEARSVGLQGTELPHEVTYEKINLLEKIRSKAAEVLGFVKSAEEARVKSPHLPLIAVVGERRDYKTVSGKLVRATDYTVLARLFTMRKMHHAYAVTGAIATSIASKIPGSIVNRYAEDRGNLVLIGHPKGVIDVKVDIEFQGKDVKVNSVTIARTARRLMSGIAYYLD